MKKLIILTLFPFILLSQENYTWDEYLDIDSCLDVHNKARAEVVMVSRISK